MGSFLKTNDLSSISTTSSYNLTRHDLQKKGHTLQFKENVNDDLQCNLCKLPLRLPTQSSCGCRYCASCIKRYLENHKPGDVFTCPSCSETMESMEMVPDYRVKKQLDKRIVYCPNNLEGCKAEFPLKDHDAHIDICDFSIVQCPNASSGCVTSLRRKDVQKHIMIDCAFRLAQCEHCQQRFPILKIKEHKLTCTFLPIQCPNNCGKKIPQSKMEEHILNDCEMVLRNCKFADSGCKFKGFKYDMEKHIHDSTSKHLEMVMVETIHLRLKDAESQRYIADLENQNSVLQAKQEEMAKNVQVLTHKCEGNAASMQTLESSLSSHLEKVNRIDEKFKSLPAIDDLNDIRLLIGPLQENVRTLRDKMREIENYNGTAPGLEGNKGLQLHNIHSRLSQMNKEVTIHAARLAEQDIRIQLTECASHDGVLLWKINDIDRRIRDAKLKPNHSLYSQPFYTSRYGYKMCARVYLNGDGIGKGTHMSLFFVVMKGDYDALLPWPFKQKVTMLLLDQSPDRRHLVDAFRPNPQSSSFQRPVKEMNIASGCPQFVALDTLESTDTYRKGNTMYIKIVVDLPDPCI
ncbi:TNF receptor-associated factor 3-like [Antedon mediterranea]|uniref:TNF receptor-associated factor 3-like n=1 Tax=Antedon mediterranea TaxID=105859 RepID=UPI003AF86078